MTVYITHGIFFSLTTFRDLSRSETHTLKDLCDITKIKTRIREPLLILKGAYSCSWEVLQNDKILYSYTTELLEKIKIKKLKLKYREIKISKEEDIRMLEDFPIIYIDESLLPEFVYIMHDLHAKILKKSLLTYQEK